jgi:hypothetical protein
VCLCAWWAGGRPPSSGGRPPSSLPLARCFGWPASVSPPLCPLHCRYAASGRVPVLVAAAAAAAAASGAAAAASVAASLHVLLLLHEERQQQVERPSPFGRRLRLSCSSREVGTVVGVEVGTYDGVDVGTCDGAMGAVVPPPSARTSGRATAPWSGPRSAGTRACPSGRRRGRGGTQASPWQATKAFAFVSARARDKPAWTGSRTGKRGTFPTGRRALTGSRMRRTSPPCGRAA